MNTVCCKWQAIRSTPFCEVYVYQFGDFSVDGYHCERHKLENVKVSLLRGRLEFYDPFVRKHNRFCRIPFFSVEIRPKKRFVHSRVDGAVD
jgi:hypothetical protein